jgi:ubiquinone/menaquinone biosynthesis C-methylase UbiE
MGAIASEVDLARLGACPSCRADLAAEARAFRCNGCGARWPIVRGIPRFVDSENYVGSFGWEWRRHRRTQIAFEEGREAERTFAEKTGLGPDDVRGKLVLDVGVGTGRFADVVARWGGTVVGADLSLAVLSARANLARHAPRALVAQADLFHLPFKAESFDVVYSIGVLHHTPSTRDALRAIARFVKPGGVLAAAVYEESPAWDFSDRYRRFTVEMSHSFLHLLCHAAIPRRYAIDALMTLRPFLGYQVRAALPMSEHADAQWTILDTFDWYSPRFQWKHDESEVRRWFEELGFEDVRRMPERTMVSVRGRRPAAGPLATPSPSEERRQGALAPVPALLPPAGPLRDAALLALLAGEVARAVPAAFARAVFSELSAAFAGARRRLVPGARAGTNGREPGR